MKPFAIAAVGTLCLAIGSITCFRGGSIFPSQLGNLNVATVVDRYQHMFHRERAYSVDGKEAMEKQSLRRVQDNDARLQTNKRYNAGPWERALDTDDSNTTGFNTTDNNSTAANVTETLANTTSNLTQAPSASPIPSPTSSPTQSPTTPQESRFDFTERDDGNNGYDFNIYTIMTNGGSEVRRYDSWMGFRNEGYTGNDRFQQSCIYRFLSTPEEPASESPSSSPSEAPSLPSGTAVPTSVIAGTSSPSASQMPIAATVQDVKIHAEWR